MGVFKMFQDDDEGRKTSTSIFSNWDDVDKRRIGVVIENTPASNPNPNHYNVLRVCEGANNLIMLVNYLDCTNYEGNKILVFENCTYDDLVKQKTIDPHFSENKNFHSPIARFEPTQRGWDMAVSFVRNVLNNSHKNQSK